MNRKFFVIFMLFTALMVFSNMTPISAQAQPVEINQIDFRRIKVDELSDQQVRQFMRRAESSGMSMQELEAEAISRGMPYNEAVKLRNRIAALDQLPEEQALQTEKGRTLAPGNMLSQRPDSALVVEEDAGPVVFGYDLFRKENLSFAPSLNIPTPRSYILGAGDELSIEVWGASQQSYTLSVSPEGQIRISNLGPIQVGGLSVEQASELIINRLSTIYSGLRGSQPNTFAQVSLGNIRSIKITIAGDAFMPGTYILPAFATAFNALYYAGGPAENGSFRDIRIVRDGKTAGTIDLYDFLIRGETELNIRLQDDDLIFIGPYNQRATIFGEVKRPAIYELRENETLADLIQFAGDFTSSAFTRQLQVDRKTESQRQLLGVEKELFSSFMMRNGDQVEVGEILETYENRVSIRGAVFREGDFALKEGMTVTELIKQAEGLREDAFMNRAAIYRLQDNLELQVIDLNLGAVIQNQAPDIALQKEDLLMVSSVLEMQQERTIRIMGEVQQPGEFQWARGTSLGEVIRKADGFTDAASLAKVEVARRISNRTSIATGLNTTEIFTFPIDPSLNIQDEASSFQLEAFDLVFVRRSPGYQTQKLVQVNGEVIFPGSYALSRKNESISELVSRSGGITPEAYLPGATLRRKVKSSDKDRLLRLAALETEGLEFAVDTIDVEFHNIGINLQRILENPNSRHDLILMEGDILEIPQQLQTVRTSGAVLYPVTAPYRDNATARKYVSGAGGFSDNARKNRVYVVYPNGSVDRTRNILGIRSYPAVEPGSEIIVPMKPERQGRTLQETIAISSAITSLALIIVTLANKL